MAFQPVPNTAMAEVIYSLNTVTCENTFYFNRVAGYDQEDIDGLADIVHTWAEDLWMANLSQDVTLISVVVTGLNSAIDLQGAVIDGVTVGGQASQALPANVSFAISRRSVYTGRSARGRIYVAGLPLNALTTNENILGSTPITNMVDDLNELRVAALTELWLEVIVSRYHEGVKRTEGEVFAVNEYRATDNRVDSRRDRLP